MRHCSGEQCGVGVEIPLVASNALPTPEKLFFKQAEAFKLSPYKGATLARSPVPHFAGASHTSGDDEDDKMETDYSTDDDGGRSRALSPSLALSHLHSHFHLYFTRTSTYMVEFPPSTYPLLLRLLKPTHATQFSLQLPLLRTFCYCCFTRKLLLLLLFARTWRF